MLDKAAVNAVADESLIIEYMSKGYLCRREMCLKGQMEEGGKRKGLVYLSILSKVGIHVVICM